MQLFTILYKKIQQTLKKISNKRKETEKVKTVKLLQHLIQTSSEKI